MKLKYYFLILALLVAAAFAIEIIALHSTVPHSHAMLICFYAAEALALIVLCYLLFFYRRAVKPMDSVMNGLELLKEQDYNSRLRKVGQTEADKIIEVFNRLMGALKEERVHLEEQNYLLDLLITASPMGVIIFDFDKKIMQANPAALKIMGCAGLCGHLLSELESPLAKFAAELRQNETKMVRLNNLNSYKCSMLSFPDRGFHHPFLLIEPLTQELMSAEKKAYGNVIRVMSHEVNNTISGVSSSLGTIRMILSEQKGGLSSVGEEDVEDIREIDNVLKVCIERCGSMACFITNYADMVKMPEPVMVPVKLNDMVQRCAKLMEQICLQKGIRLEVNLAPENPEVQADALLFEQALQNIIKNACESIEAKSLQTGESPEKDADGAGVIRIVTTSDPAGVEISDNGAGISQEAAAKLFTPFYSTKPKGQGIGLMFTREVLAKHGCEFSLATGEDHITRFKIFFSL